MYKEYTQTTYTSQIDKDIFNNYQYRYNENKLIYIHKLYNYAAVEPTLLSAIDFLTNGTVNRIISDDRINCNVLALSYSLNLGQIPFIFLYSIFLIRIYSTHTITS